MTKTIIESLYNYFNECPLLQDGYLNIDYLPDGIQNEGIQYSIDTSPSTEVVKRYIGVPYGALNETTIQQYQFDIRTITPLNVDVAQAISNSGFYEDLSRWLVRKNAKQELPELPEGKHAQMISTLSTGYLGAAGADVCYYLIQCRLQYLQEGEK